MTYSAWVVLLSTVLKIPQPKGLKAWLWILLFALIDGAMFQGFLTVGLVNTGAGLGAVLIDVKHPGATSLLYSVALLKQGEMLVIFPEGAIIREKQVAPLKRGVARIALDVVAQVPDSEIKILPVSLNYSQNYPTWGTDVQVKIGEAIAVKNYDVKKIRASSEALTQDLQKRLKFLQEGLG